uniref:Coatomer beta subunit appendage platform domain-containing protein n=1 Tax=Spongospora subterranea TaxID=70186 RepID=A0A0H5QIE9_9EUKA|eukprot:CRZ01829.1 hypothetical protein [Spongospora subterranea]
MCFSLIFHVRELESYIQHIVETTNMKCLTDRGDELQGCDFLAVNLYAKSIFGEDALLNISIEKQELGSIAGYIRIRAKAQGIALSLGDRILAHQRQRRKHDP